MNWIKMIFCGLAVAMLLQACTIEKRRYMSGWHIDWRTHRQESSADVVSAPEPGNPQDSLTYAAPADLASGDFIENVETTMPEEENSNGNEAVVSPPRPQNSDVRSDFRKQPHVRIGEQLFQGRVAELESPQSTGGQVLGIIGFVLLLISIGLLLVGVLAELGWTSLGLIIMAMLLAAAAFVFALIAFLANRHAGDPTPWFVWMTLIIGGLAVFLWLKVLLDRA